MAADAAVRGIRELDQNGSVGIISTEPDPPYARPPLSKGLWKGRPVDKIWRNTQSLGVELYLDRRARQLHLRTRTVKDDRGEEYGYERLLLATGGYPQELASARQGTIYYRTLRDYRKLRELADSRDSFVVIGGGFIGAEMAAALCMVGKDVTLLFREEAIGSKVYTKELARFLVEYYEGKGVRVIANESVANVIPRDGRYTVWTQGGLEFKADGVVAGFGIRPNVELAKQAGLEVDDGILVDEHLQTSAADIYAAGDVANFVHPALRMRMRVEHEDNALKMGQAAGRNMAGANEPYTHIPMFYSDLFELGYEAVGELNSGLETVVDWQDAFRKGTIYYLGQGRVRGVLLWNVWSKVDAARELLQQAGPFAAADLKGKIT
jgi:3-phenylpropionate/trans-cinnamate dioxygenase ferredoxin reductase subunit